MQIEYVEKPERAAAGDQLRIKNILVPTDLSEDSLKPLAYAIALTKQFDATLWLAHIVEPAPDFTGYEGIPLIRDPIEEDKEAERRLTEFAARHVPSGVPVTALVRNGPAVREIVSLAKDDSIDLVVISTHGRTGLSRALYGSMAERILHQAPCPILIVRDREHDFIDARQDIHLQKIFVPLDFSNCSRKAVRYAEAFARSYGAQLLAVHFLEPEKPKIIVETESFEREQRIAAEQKMASQLAEMDPSLPLESALMTGVPEQAIVSYATEQNVDLIILGEHCKSGMKRFLLGTVADKVIQHAPCPVLVVRESEREFVQ